MLLRLPCIKKLSKDTTDSVTVAEIEDSDRSLDAEDDESAPWQEEVNENDIIELNGVVASLILPILVKSVHKNALFYVIISGKLLNNLSTFSKIT